MRRTSSSCFKQARGGVPKCSLLQFGFPLDVMVSNYILHEMEHGHVHVRMESLMRLKRQARPEPGVI